MGEAEAKKKLGKMVSPEVLADETRFEIMKALSRGDLYCAQLNTRFPNASKHLMILEKEGIIKTMKKGFLTFYSLANAEIADILNAT